MAILLDLPKKAVAFEADGGIRQAHKGEE